MTTKTRKREIPLKPLAAVLIIITAVWCVMHFDGIGRLGSAISRGLSGNTALALLQTETSGVSINAPTAEVLLSFATPLLATTAHAAESEQRTASPVNAPPRPENLPPAGNDQPPLLNPMLEYTETDERGAEIDISLWDDRVWEVPTADTPGSRRLREVTLLPTNPDGTYIVDGTVVVSNNTGLSFDLQELMSRNSGLSAQSGDEPQILIIHTHGSESFLPDERHFYIPTDIERTEDIRYNVVRLGKEMASRFEAMGINVIHDQELHDYPTFRGSYGRSLETIQQHIAAHPSIQIVLDIHRDWIEGNNESFKVVSETIYGKTAQMMFVVGSNASGLPHENWRQNLGFAARLQNLLLNENPTFMRPITLRRERFNHHATPNSLILEVGTAANTLTEALRAINYFCDIIGPYLVKELAIDN